MVKGGNLNKKHEKLRFLGHIFITIQNLRERPEICFISIESKYKTLSNVEKSENFIDRIFLSDIFSTNSL